VLSGVHRLKLAENRGLRRIFYLSGKYDKFIQNRGLRRIFYLSGKYDKFIQNFNLET
jgi:hypothetical protein